MFASKPPVYFVSSDLHSIAKNIINHLKSMRIDESGAIEALSNTIGIFFKDLNQKAKVALFECLIQKFGVLQQELNNDNLPCYFRLLHILVAAGNKENLEIFLQCIPKEKLSKLLNEIEPAYGNSLIFSLYSDDPEIAKLLIHYGADKTLTCETKFNDEEVTPFELVAASGKENFFAFLDAFYINPEKCKTNLYEKIMKLLDDIKKDFITCKDKEVLLKVANYLKAKNWPGFENFGNEFDAGIENISQSHTTFYESGIMSPHLDNSALPFNVLPLYQIGFVMLDVLHPLYRLAPFDWPITVPVLPPIFVTSNQIRISEASRLAFFQMPTNNDLLSQPQQTTSSSPPSPFK